MISRNLLQEYMLGEFIYFCLRRSFIMGEYWTMDYWLTFKMYPNHYDRIQAANSNRCCNEYFLMP
jgi:hypothetical protein